MSEERRCAETAHSKAKKGRKDNDVIESCEGKTMMSSSLAKPVGVRKQTAKTETDGMKVTQMQTFTVEGLLQRRFTGLNVSYHKNASRLLPIEGCSLSRRAFHTFALSEGPSRNIICSAKDP